MATRILVEIILFLLPFAVFLAYRAASKDLKVSDRWPLTTLTLVGAGLAIIALVVTPLLAPSDDGKCYQAARYENGVTIPAQMIDCDQVTVPGRETPESTAPPPVAPRDRTVQ